MRILPAILLALIPSACSGDGPGLIHDTIVDGDAPADFSPDTPPDTLPADLPDDPVTDAPPEGPEAPPDPCDDPAVNIYAGTCWERFWEGCWDPSGDCTVLVEGSTVLIEWENGAYTESHADSGLTIGSYYNSLGILCAEATSSYARRPS